MKIKIKCHKKRCKLLSLVSLLFITQLLFSQVTLEQEIKITDLGLHFDGTKVGSTASNTGDNAPYDYFFGRNISAHGDAIKTYGNYVFMTWYKGGKSERNVMLTRYNTVTGSLATIQFPHKHTGYLNRYWIGESHNTIAVGISPLDGTIHLLYDMHAYSSTKPSDGSLANDYFRYSYSVKNAASLSDSDFTLDKFVQNSSGGYKHLQMPGTAASSEFLALTYPKFFQNDQGDLLMFMREGGNNNGMYKFTKYDANTGMWSIFTDFNRLNARSQPGITYNWGLYGDIKYVNGKIRIGFQRRSQNNDDKFLFQNGVYYAYSDDQTGASQWKNHQGTDISLPLLDADDIKIMEPGDYVQTTQPNKIRIVGGFDWTVTANEDVHFISEVRDLENNVTKYLHTYKAADDSDFTTSDDFSGGTALYTSGTSVFLIGLNNSGRVFIEKAEGGTNNFNKVYEANSGRQFDHGVVHIENGKVYYYLMENASGNAQPLYLQIIDLDLNEASPNNQITVEVEDGTVGGGDSSTAVLGSDNGGTDNVLKNVRKKGTEVTITNSVTIPSAGDYDFTLTYYTGSANNATIQFSGTGFTTFSHELEPNNGTASAVTYGTVTISSIALDAGTYDIELRAKDPYGFSIDNYIISPVVTKPTITLLGDATVNTFQGDTYNDAGATALAGDGTTNITADIVTVNPVNVNTIGTYTVTYNVTNAGLAADEVTRTVNVIAVQTITATQTGNWNDTATWGGNPVPGASNEVFVPDGILVTVTDAQAAKKLKVTNGANVVVDSGGALSITGDVFLGRFDFGLEVRSQTSTEPMGTLTVGGSVYTMNSDDVTTTTSDKRLFVRKTLANDKWYLLSSIASKQPRLFYMTNSDFRTNATNRSIALYNNANAPSSKYDYFADGTVSNDANNNIQLGAGMSVSVRGTGNSNTTGEFGYKAFYSHGSSVDIAISADNGTGGTGDAFNLVGNPFLANLYGNDETADAVNNVLTVNTGVLEEATLWFWNGDTSSWVTRNQSSPAFTIPPLTGFFVKSSAAGGNFTFTESMETHTAAGSIASKTASNRFEIDLSVSIGKDKRSTSIKYIENMTTDFDNGYDSSTFGGYASSFEVYTNLLSNDAGKKLGIQSLPNSDFESMIIPVGLTAEANSQITFTAKALNVPMGYKVYLEDRLNSTFTRLDEANAEYTTTVSETSTEGRFYLHTRSSALSTDSELLNSVSIYKSNASTLRIVGLSQGEASVKLFNIMGKQVMMSNFNTTGVKELALPNLSTGVYIVQLETKTGKLNKRIVLE